MRAIQVECPELHGPLCIEIDVDFETLKSKWSAVHTAYCPHCRRSHEFMYRALYVWSVLEHPSMSELNNRQGREAILKANQQDPPKVSRPRVGTPVPTGTL